MFGEEVEDDFVAGGKLLEKGDEVVFIYVLLIFDQYIRPYPLAFNIIILHTLFVPPLLQDEVQNRLPQDKQTLSDIRRALGYLLAYVSKSLILKYIQRFDPFAKNMFYLRT